MDGLAGGVAMFAALGFFIISLSNGQLLVAALSAAICGSCIGFLFWNRNPARIYMGDSGALFLGFMLAAISIRVDSGGSNYLQSIFTPLVMLAIPFIDTAQVIISRLRRGVSPLQGGRDHISHKLLLLGVNEKTAVQIIWLCAIVFSLIAITISGVLN
jgi:UDP-GlcNAc:undecaprenyl-phosphate GlcNAc-1-phosphate transferase